MAASRTVHMAARRPLLRTTAFAESASAMEAISSSPGFGSPGGGASAGGVGSSGSRLCLGIPARFFLLHMHELVRAMVSLVGQVMLWQGLWDLELYHGKETLWREACYMAVGLLCFIASDKLPLYIAAVYDRAGRGGVWERTLELSRGSVSAGSVLRAALSILGQTTHMVGAWTLFDTYLTVPGDSIHNTG